MGMEDTISRINALYHKSKAQGLGQEEKEEQQALRRVFLDSVRNNLRAQLDNIDLQDAQGNIENLGEKMAAKRAAAGE